MINEREKILDKACKLKELADRGIDGEKDNAIRFLATYKEKHGISDQELRRHKIKDEHQYRSFNTDAMIKNMTDDLIAKGYDILATSYKHILNNAVKLHQMKQRYSNAKPEIKWKHDSENYTFKGFVSDILNFDIQQTKQGATLYKSRGVSVNMNFASVGEAKSFCTILINESN